MQILEKMMMNNKSTKINKGFSYIELIVVIGIMAVMVGMASLSISIISRNNVTKAAEKLESAVNQARTTTMAKGSKNGCLEISTDGSAFYYYIGNPGEPESKKARTKFATSPLYVQLVTEHGNTYNMSEIGTYVFKFNRATGGLKKSEYVAIRVTNDNTTCDVTISELTGKTAVELR